MIIFPLYDTLYKESTNKKDLTIKQKNELLLDIKNLDDNSKELFYVLIQYYYQKNNYFQNNQNNENILFIPYNPTTIKNQNNSFNITWNLNNFPIHLKQILYNFIVLHKKSKEEEISRT